MWNTIKKIFVKLFSEQIKIQENSTPKYTLGAFESPHDNRNIALASFQDPVGLQSEFETELPPVEDQGAKPKCVGSAVHKIAELYLTPKGEAWINLSDDDLYEQCKAIDGIPYQDGTYPSVGAKIICSNGVATVEAYNTKDKKTIEDSRAKNKLQGYAFVNADYVSICQAIQQNKAITAAFSIDTNWFLGIITKILKSIGRHYIVLNGFRLSDQSLKGQNSWGSKWIGYIAGIFNQNVKSGHFEVLWKDVSETISDIIAFPFVPKELIENATKNEYRFTQTMKQGSSGYEVQKLQERLNKEGFACGKADGSFGKNTKNAVIGYQKSHILIADGIVGAGTRAELNKSSKSLIADWAEAIQLHEGYYAGSRSYRNNNPANFKVGATLTGYMKSLGAIGTDKDGFVIFPDYNTGFKALCIFLQDACEGELSSYKPTMTLNQFFAVYAPENDGNKPNTYAQFVAGKIKISPDTQIKNLV